MLRLILTAVLGIGCFGAIRVKPSNPQTEELKQVAQVCPVYALQSYQAIVPAVEAEPCYYSPYGSLVKEYKQLFIANPTEKRCMHFSQGREAKANFFRANKKAMLYTRTYPAISRRSMPLLC